MLLIAPLVAGVLIAALVFAVRDPLHPRSPATQFVINAHTASHTRKPGVISEMIRLAAWSQGLECRCFARILNRRFAIERRMTVSKTGVALLRR